MRTNTRLFEFLKNLSPTLRTLTFIFFSTLSFSQTTTINTPNGTPVSVFTRTEFTQSQIASTNATALAAFPGTTIVSNSSKTYNCHAYAWYLTECASCPKYWMNTPQDDKYWLDCSYVEVPVAQAQKISYPNGDHSAVKSVVSGKFDSKWGEWPVMRHDPTDTPYNATGLKYYAKPAISGPTTICTTGSFNVIIPSGAVATWSISPSNAATFPAGTSSTKIFTRSSSFTGNAIVTATLANSSGCSSITIKRSVSMGSTTGGTLNLTAPGVSTPGGSIVVSVSGSTGTYSWFKNGNLLATTAAGNNITLQFGCSGGLLTVRANNSCTEVSRVIGGNCQGGTNSMMVYPNPSSSEIFIGLAESTEQQYGGRVLSVTKEESIKTEIYDFSGNLVLAKQFEKSGSVPSIDISELKRATYFLRIIGKEVDEVHQIIKE